MSKDEVETKKALAFIRANAGEVPKKIRTSTNWQIPDEVVKEIIAKVEDFDGAVSIPLAGLNKLFGWKETSARTSYLTKKLTEAYDPSPKVWHVGTRNKKEVYVFTMNEPKED